MILIRLIDCIERSSTKAQPLGLCVYADLITKPIFYINKISKGQWTEQTVIMKFIM